MTEGVADKKARFVALRVHILRLEMKKSTRRVFFSQVRSEAQLTMYNNEQQLWMTAKNLTLGQNLFILVYSDSNGLLSEPNTSPSFP